MRKHTVALGIALTYVPTWGIWEGVRELIQNALDAEDKGASLQIVEPRMSGGALQIHTSGVIPESSILVGWTSKADDDTQRGQYGEGLKLGLMALMRKGVSVEIHTGGRSMTPVSTTMKGTGDIPVLGIQIGSSKVQDTRVDIEISQGVWDALKLNFIRFSSSPSWSGKGGRVLTDPSEKGRLYVKGIFVCQIRATYGYDLDGCTLDRDRRIPSASDVEARTSRLHAEYATAQGKIRELIAASDESATDTLNLWSPPKGFSEAVEAVLSEDGFQAVAVASDNTSEARALGIAPRVVSSGLFYALPTDLRMGTRVQAARQAVSRVFFPEEYTEAEARAISWLTDVTGCTVLLVESAQDARSDDENRLLVSRSAIASGFAFKAVQIAMAHVDLLGRAFALSQGEAKPVAKDKEFDLGDLDLAF